MSVFAYDKHAVAAAVRAQRARTVALLESLDAQQWEHLVLPGWRVREVAAHLISSDEAALTGRLALLGLRQVPIATIEAWNDTQVRRWVDRPVPSLLRALEVWGRRIGSLARRMPSPVARAVLPTPLGSVSLLWLGMMRVYDEWIHDEDIRRALGFASDDAPDVVRPVARQLHAVIPVQTLDRIPAGASGVVALAYADLELPAFGFDLGARRYGAAAAASATSTVTASATTMIMIAAGRDRWRDVEARGALRITGERAPAETVLDALLAV